VAVQDGSRCRLCGGDGALAVEDARAAPGAGGDPAKVFGLERWLGRGRSETREAGAYTLCPVCNDTAADWYLAEFRNWSRVAADLIATGPADADLDRDPRPSWTTAELRDVRPARFLKQLLTMLVAIAPAGFAGAEHDELVAYAQAPGRRGLPSRYQVYLALYRGPYARFVGYSLQLERATGRPTQLIELAHPPFACVLSLTGEAPIETTNISEFAELPIDESCVVDLDLQNGFGHTPFPADFRTLAAVERDREADRRAA